MESTEEVLEFNGYFNVSTEAFTRYDSFAPADHPLFMSGEFRRLIKFPCFIPEFDRRIDVLTLSKEMLDSQIRNAVGETFFFSLTESASILRFIASQWMESKELRVLFGGESRDILMFVKSPLLSVKSPECDVPKDVVVTVKICWTLRTLKLAFMAFRTFAGERLAWPKDSFVLSLH